MDESVSLYGDLFWQLIYDDIEATVIWFLMCNEHIPRRSSLYRKRWDSNYLINLARDEGSFLRSIDSRRENSIDGILLHTRTGISLP